MYAAFFGLQQEAFSIAPDPRFLHLTEGHREALAHLLYGLQGGGGFVLLSGEIGTGKTTVCRCFLEQIPAGYRVAYLYNPRLTAVELLQTINQEFGIAALVPPPTTTKPYVDALNAYLLDAHARGEQCLLVVDEAQGLAPDLLEMLRLLTNLETAERKLLQILLIGQPELRDLLQRPELEQLAQRIIARVHLGPLSATETTAYIGHRLAVAGLQGPLPFSERALTRIHHLSGGVPRRINLLCQRALLGAYGKGLRQVDAAMVQAAAHEVFDSRPPPRWRAPVQVGVAALVALAGAAAIWQWGTGLAHLAIRTPAAAASAPSAVTMSAAGAASGTPVDTALHPFTDGVAATAALAQAWGLETADTEPCRAARSNALACYEGQVDLALLRRLDRPLLLRLEDGGLLLLQALAADHARVLGAAGPKRAALPTLQSIWKGQVLAWWRPPPADAPDWVLTRLLALQGPETAAGARAPADEVLRRRVFAFQLGQGLPLDGLAGPLTLMQLNRASGVAEPRLHALP